MSAPTSLYKEFFYQRNGFHFPTSGQATPSGHSTWEAVIAESFADYLDLLTSMGAQSLTGAILGDTIYGRGERKEA